LRPVSHELSQRAQKQKETTYEEKGVTAAKNHQSVSQNGTYACSDVSNCIEIRVQLSFLSAASHPTKLDLEQPLSLSQLSRHIVEGKAVRCDDHNEEPNITFARLVAD